MTTTEQNQSIDASGDTTTKPAEQLIWFYGLDNIAHYMHWGKLKVLRMNQKHNFPLLRMPTPERHHWQYATNTLLVLIWMNSMAEEAYRHVAQTALGRKLRATRSTQPAETSTPPAPLTSDPPPPPSDSTLQTPDIATNPDHV